MNHLSELNRYFRNYKKKLFLGFFFILIANSAQIYIPIVLRDSIDALQNNFEFELLLNYALLIVGAAFVSGIFRFLIRETIIVVSREIEYDLLNDFWEKIQKLPLRFFKNTPIGELMALGTNDISAIRMYFGPAVMYSVDTITKFLIIITIIFLISTKLTFYALIPLPVSSYVVYVISKLIHKKFTAIQEKFAELTARAQENFSGIRVIKSYVREESEIKSFKRLSEEYKDRNIEKIKIQALFMPLLFMFIGITAIVVIWVGGTMVIDAELTLGELTAFVVYLGLLTWPMIAFGWVANLVQQADASMGRIKKVFEEENEIETAGNPDSSITDILGLIEFNNVSFRYGDNQPEVLENINISVKPGETLAVIGHTGSGKSSFVNLIPRLFDVTGGEVLIDGKDSRKIPLEVLRNSIGFVPQEAFLFSDTIKNNILFGMDNPVDQFMLKVSGISKLDKDVDLFKDKYATVIGERGITLSGGQKQRASLARALAKDPAILILDDSFSAVDTNTEEEILQELKSFMADRTTIIISHRISTVKDANKIIVLQDGRIVEQGNHESLVKQKGIYAELHYKQLLEDELRELK